MRPLLILPSLFCFSILPLGAEVTPQDIAEELDSPAGITWQAEGPDADSWNVIGDLYTYVSSASPGPRRLTASFTGPAVISLNTVISGNATGRILVDGVASGGFLGALVRDRVQVDSGAHEVTWEFTPQAGASANVKLNGLEWIPGPAGAPLQSGANGPSVTLTGPWAGQTAFHYKDGAAAWSGIVLSAPAGEVHPEVELRGDFTGPGVLSYRAHGRDGEGRFMLDDGDWTELGLGWSKPWTRRFMRVGPGQHIARWAPVREVLDFRCSTDMMVDEVQIRPEVDIAVALETPARIWTAALTGTDRAFGMEMEETPDGAGVALQGEAVISTPVTEGQVFRMRVRGYLRFLGHQGEELPVHLIEQEAETTDGPWRTVAIRVAQTGTMTIGSQTGTGGVVDKVEVMEIPADIASFLGLPENAFSTGGAPWRIALDETVGQYVLESETSAEEPEAWLDIPVTGPALVRIGFKVNSTARELRMLVDGKEAWDSSGDGWVTQHAQEVKIEIPAGVHTLRCQAKTSYPFAPVKLLGVEISPLAGGGLDGNAADDAIWAYSGGWERTDAVDHDGGGAIRPVAFTHYGGGMPVLRRLFSGPGTLRFHRYLEEDGLSNSATYWVMKDDRGYEATERSSYSNYGWGDEWERWYPQGEHWFEWSASRIDGTAPKLVLDAIGFTPSETIDLAAAFGAAGLAWQNDALLPWSGVRKEAGEPPVVVSPPLSAGESTAISTIVNGPGIVSFRWKAGGRLQAVGNFYINDERAAGVYRAGTEIPVTLMVEQTGPVKLEWRAEGSNRGDWIEIRDFKWSEWQESTLASALDAGPEVTWTTSSPNPFIGRPHHDSEGGTAAYVSLEPGGESWLEATVEGPGLYHFQLRDALGGNPWPDEDWELTVDGRKIALQDRKFYWPALYIEGGGTHRIRLSFRTPLSGYYPQSIVVDDVSWTPITPAAVESGWTADAALGSPRYYANGGKEGAPQTILRLPPGKTTWIEKTVTGPGLLEWDSKLNVGLVFGFLPKVDMTMDGHGVMNVGRQNEWRKYRLHIPAGVHTVRWESAEFPIGENVFTPETGEDLGSYLQMSGFTFTPGIPALVQALEADALMLLEIGEAGQPLTGTAAHDGVDAWQMAQEPELYICNPSLQGIRVRGWRHYPTGWLPSEGSWGAFHAWIPPGQHILWGGDVSPPYPDYREVLDTLTAEFVTVTPLAEAVDTTLDTAVDWAFSGGWTGLAAAADSYDGQDGAWSLVSGYGQSNRLTTRVMGPAKITFRWKHTGLGALVAQVDGKSLLVQPPLIPLQAPPNGDWGSAEIHVDEGIHTLTWLHAATTGTSPREPGNAWVDEVSVVRLPARTLDDVATTGPALPLSNTAVTLPERHWKPVSYLGPDRLWRDAARCFSGYSALKASVTGPAVLEFKGRCVETDVSSGSDHSGVTVEVGLPAAGHFLMVKVGGREQVRISLGTGWQSRAIHIPAGRHEVSWQVYSLLGGTATGMNFEGWVDDITVQSPADHYDAWRSGKTFPEGKAGPDDDADGDGVTNYAEYAWGRNPLDASSKPPAVTGKVEGLRRATVDGPQGSPAFAMWVPYLLPHVPGRLEMSKDLVEWETVPQALLGMRPSVTGGSYQYDTDTHQFFQFPLQPGEKAKFFRVHLNPVSTP